MTMMSKLEEFKVRQSQILEMHAKAKKEVEELAAAGDAKIEEIKSEFEKKKAELMAPFEREKELYKADMKAAFGVTDGESANILDLVGLIHRVTSQHD